MQVSIFNQTKQSAWNCFHAEGVAALAGGLEIEDCPYSSCNLFARCAWMAGYCDGIAEVAMDHIRMVFPDDLTICELKQISELGIQPAWLVVNGEYKWRWYSTEVLLGEIEEISTILGADCSFEYASANYALFIRREQQVKAA